jgi:DNA-3-methyladenine glycosylase
LARQGSLEVALTDVVEAARRLIGCYLVRTAVGGRRTVRIVETEAYPHDDPACHAYSGPTARNRSMFGPAGRAYVYRIHRSYCLNVVTGPIGRGEAVLIRAAEPVEGLELMEAARRASTVGARVPTGQTLANGPGKLCQALAIDLTLDGVDLLSRHRDAALCLLEGDRPPEIAITPRVGISKATDRLLRFADGRSRWVSHRRSANTRMRD